MANPIEWTDATWNPIVGCTVHSAGCTNCYAMKMAGRLEAMAPQAAGTGNPHMTHYEGTTKRVRSGYVWTGKVNMAPESTLLKPLSWKKPRKIFVNSMSDLFHEDVPDEWIDRIFAVMALCPQHQFQVLTKRSARMRAYMADRVGKLARFMIDEYLIRGTVEVPLAGRAIDVSWPVQSIGDVDMPDDVTMRVWPLPNVWLGVSVEDQRAADERIPDLLATPAAVRWISAEPLLGPVDLRFLHTGDLAAEINALAGTHGVLRPHRGTNSHLDWVVAGGESGPGARPMHPDWARSLRDQCQAAGVPFLFKQWGEMRPYQDDRADCAWMDPNGSFYQGPTTWPPKPNEPRVAMVRVGKKAAGRLLDGVLHDGYPA